MQLVPNVGFNLVQFYCSDCRQFKGQFENSNVGLVEQEIVLRVQRNIRAKYLAREKNGD